MSLSLGEISSWLFGIVYFPWFRCHSPVSCLGRGLVCLDDLISYAGVTLKMEPVEIVGSILNVGYRTDKPLKQAIY